MTTLERLTALGITGARATLLAGTLDDAQVARASDAQLRVMIAGRESGENGGGGGHLYPDGKLYPA